MESIYLKPFVDSERIKAIRLALTLAYESKNREDIEKAAREAQRYIDEGGDADYELDDALEDYKGAEPQNLADQYILRLLRDRHCDNDSDAEYIRTGWSHKKEVSTNYQQFLQFREKYPNTVILFRYDEAYGAFDECADVVNKVCDCPLLSWDGIKAAGFPKAALDINLPRLIRAGHRVAICDQLKDIAKARKQVECTKELHRKFYPEKYRKEPVQLELFAW